MAGGNDDELVILLDTAGTSVVDGNLTSEVERVLQDLARHLEGAAAARRRLMELMKQDRRRPVR